MQAGQPARLRPREHADAQGRGKGPRTPDPSVDQGTRAGGKC
jgi:hypothetical protein